MATITCKIKNCPYLSGKIGDEVRFCRANSIWIMENGLCGNVFTPKGEPRKIDKVYWGFPPELDNENNDAEEEIEVDAQS